MGAFCSCFSPQTQETTVSPSIDTNISHQNTTTILSFFNKYTKILRLNRASTSLVPEEEASSEDVEFVINVSLESAAPQPIPSNASQDTQGTYEAAALYSSSSEESCSTCFERYSEENPKITAECSHHFHLPCIYEWMERSDSCPFCRQLLKLGEGFER